jgi:outer membrane protein assembly factor BamB
MESQQHNASLRLLPVLFGCIALAVILIWALRGADKPLQLRLPGADDSPVAADRSAGNPVLLGTVVAGVGTASELDGSWPQFRGVARDGIAPASNFATRWPGGRPPELWSAEVGEGYAGPAIAGGRVFLMDYDRKAKKDALRCLSLADGREIWRFTYPVNIKRNHGMTRTVPAIADGRVVAIGPKCHVVCCDAQTGELRWTRDLVQEFGAMVPEWYAGQCPLIDGDQVVLAPGGPEALLVALRLDDGEVIWRTPNAKGWKMTHSSIMPAEFGGRRQYIYCANKGVVGVSADEGRLLWETADWKISIATVPSPCVVDENRVFLSGGYNAGSMMLQLEAIGGGLSARPLFRLQADIFGATQHSPILHQNHIYGIRADGRLVCLALDGRVAWESGASETFGLGPMLLAGDWIYAMDDSGLLRLIAARPDRYEKMAEARVLEGRESWGPMALAGTRLLVRDFTRLACLEVGNR